MYDIAEIEKVDAEIADAIRAEIDRQNSHIELIASENWTSKAVMAAMGSPLTNKYAEGYPGKRYYGGCSCVDVVETLAIERAKKLFHCEFANVQPHSGAQANMAVFYAVLKPGDTVLGMNLSEGGHLSHGSPHNLSGSHFNSVFYGVNEDGYIDYDEVLRIAKECQPKLIVAGASAYPRKINFRKFREIADEVGAYLLADIAHIAGLVVAGLHQSPIPYADITTTTTHKTLRGPRGGLILSSQKIADELKLNKAVFPGIQGGPLMHVIAAKAVCFQEALEPSFRTYAQGVVDNAQALAKGLKKRGVKLISDGTDNHLMMIDLRDSRLSGRDLEQLLDQAHITANKNTVPGEKRPAATTSGVRLGTAAATSRGLDVQDMDLLAVAISLVYQSTDNIPAARAIVQSITSRHPLDA